MEIQSNTGVMCPVSCPNLKIENNNGRIFIRDLSRTIQLHGAEFHPVIEAYPLNGGKYQVKLGASSKTVKDWSEALSHSLALLEKI
jgi:hypothetical protein